MYWIWRAVWCAGSGVPSLGVHFDPQNGPCENQHQIWIQGIQIPVLFLTHRDAGVNHCNQIHLEAKRADLTCHLDPLMYRNRQTPSNRVPIESGTISPLDDPNPVGSGDRILGAIFKGPQNGSHFGA